MSQQNGHHVEAQLLETGLKETIETGEVNKDGPFNSNPGNQRHGTFQRQTRAILCNKY